ncbi:MAG TPA: hypothetical protein VN922_24730 [Bacteroidia bacterium]|nr:hypothetical protein [Bacteroidia bacterium]
MKSIFQSEYSKFFTCSLVLTIVAAWFSLGYNQADEHFQILEFANYKLGNGPVADLAWEFNDKIRPGLQPFIAYCTIAVFHFIGLYNPFIIAFLFRLGIGLLTWLITCKLVIVLLPEFKTERGKKLFVLLNLFLWFIPYFSVRFSSENTATVSFLWALYLILKPYESKRQESISYLFVGLLLGASFFFRFQIAFAIIGLGAWLLFIKKIKLQNWLAIIFPALCVSAVCVYLDKWMYGTWQFTPYNYYDANIVRHIAAGFGTSPWWDYFATFFLLGIPPISLVLMAFLFVGVYKRPMHVLLFVLIPFLLGHIVIAHKEMRFLTPIIFPFIFLAAIGIDHFILTYKSRKIYTYGFGLMVAVNTFMLLYRTFTPAQEAIPYLRYAYYTYKEKPTTILCIEYPLYNLYGLNFNFYKPANINEVVLKNEDSLVSYLTTNMKDSAIVFQRNVTLSPKLSNMYRSKRIYMPYPEWIFNFDFNGWAERAHIWSIYTLYKK